MHLLQIAPRCNGPSRTEARGKIIIIARARARICAPLAQLPREGDRAKERGIRARRGGGGRTGAPRPPKVKSRDGEGPGGEIGRFERR